MTGGGGGGGGGTGGTNGVPTPLDPPLCLCCTIPPP